MIHFLSEDNLFNPDILLYTTVNITTTEYCQSEFDALNSENELIVTENMICGSDNQDEFIRDTCQVRYTVNPYSGQSILLPFNSQ